MDRRQILIWPDRRLMQVAAPVHTFDDALDTTINALIDTLAEANGLGLAAPQLGIRQRIVLVRDQYRWLDDTGRWLDEVHVLVNPAVVAASGAQESIEACLSVPGIEVVVPRATAVTVKYRSRRGDHVTVNWQGLLATCVQHEIDHLDGKTIVDYLPTWRREALRKKMLAAQRRLA